MPVRIPYEHREGLANLIALSDEEANRLYQALAAEGPALYPPVLERRAAETSRLELSRVRPIIGAVISLITSRDRQGLSTDTVANDIATAAASEGVGGLQIDSPAVAIFKQRLVQFIGLEQPLGVTARALDVMTQHKNVLQRSRILTDIRPIFSSGDNPQPTAAVIVHNLQLVTYSDGDFVTFVAALDSQDLRSLAKVITRAIQKEKSLKSVISTGGLSYIDVVQPPLDSEELEDEQD
jgi:hypothetical protein